MKPKIINQPEYFKNLIVLLIITIIYFVAGKLGLRLAFFNLSVSAIWPPAGIALAAFLLLGYRVWPAIFIGAYLVNITTTPSVPTSLGIALGNTLEGFIGAYLVNTYAGGWRFFERVLHVFKFTIYAAAFASAVSATIGVFSLISTGYASPDHFIQIWFTWWFGDLGGVLILAPFLIIWIKQKSQLEWNKRTIVEAIAFFLAFALVALVIFADITPINLQHYSLKYLAILIVVWSAFRFSHHETTLSIVILTFFAILSTLQGRGPFISFEHSQNESVILLQIFMSVMALAGLAISALESEQEKSNKKVKNSEERYRNLVQMAPDVIYGLSADGKFTDLNPAFERIAGWKVSDWVGKPFIQIVHPDDRKIAIDKFKHGLGGEPTMNFELRIRTKSGRYVIGAFSSAPKIEEGVVVGKLGVARDITVEKEIEKMKTDFFTITAHQLRTPLTHIRWNVEMMLVKNNFNIPDIIRKGLEQIYLDDIRMIELINKLMKIVRFEQGHLANKPKEINAVQVVQKILKEHKTEAQLKSINLELKTAKAPISAIFVDPDRFNEVIDNLISNAIKYSEKGRVTVNIESDGKNLDISVSDRGIGIPKNEQEKIFSQFFRAENAVMKKTEGSGLGLSLVKTYVDNWGGDIWFESEENKGSTFYVSIPLTTITS